MPEKLHLDAHLPLVTDVLSVALESLPRGEGLRIDSLVRFLRKEIGKDAPDKADLVSLIFRLAQTGALRLTPSFDESDGVPAWDVHFPRPKKETTAKALKRLEKKIDALVALEKAKKPEKLAP